MDNQRTYEIKPIPKRPGIVNKWMVTERTNGQVTAAWGFRTKREATKFDAKKLGRQLQKCKEQVYNCRVTFTREEPNDQTPIL